MSNVTAFAASVPVPDGFIAVDSITRNGERINMNVTFNPSKVSWGVCSIVFNLCWDEQGTDHVKNTEITVPENCNLIEDPESILGIPADALIVSGPYSDWVEGKAPPFNNPITISVSFDDNESFDKLYMCNAADGSYNLGLAFDANVNEKIALSKPLEISIASNVDEPVYSISPAISDEKNSSLNIGDTFDVDVVVTADQSDANLGAVDAVLNYDSTLVKLTGTKNGVLTENVDIDGETGRVFATGSETPVTVGESGITVATFTFQAIAEGEAEFSIADGALVGQNGVPAEIPATVGKTSVAIENIQLISNDSYKGAASGDQVLRYTALKAPAEGNAYYYGDRVLSLVETTEKGQYIFEGFVNAGITADSLESVVEKEGSYATIAHSGDVNGNQKVNAIDCLIAYDLSTGNEAYLNDTEYSLLSAVSRLEADVNNSTAVDASDCRAIMNMALGKAS